MKKKFIAAAACLASAVCMFSLSSCATMIDSIVTGVMDGMGLVSSTSSSGSSGTAEFTGQVSEETYTSTEEAVKAFLDNEVSGNSTVAEFVSYEKQSDVSESELQELGLEDSFISTIDSAEKGTVTYSDASNEVSSAGISLAAASVSDLTYTQNVYVFRIGETYKYFVPALSTGETLTKSYFESVYDIENYKNCTMTYKTIASAVSTYGTETGEMTMEIDYTIKYTETAIYMDFDMSYVLKADGDNDAESASMSIYFFDQNGTFVCVVGYEGQWVVSDASSLGLDISSVEDIYEIAQSETVDFTYFEKTDTGFALRSDKYVEYLAAMLGEDYAELFGTEGVEFDAEATYIVTDGRLSKGTSYATINMTVDGITSYASASAECVYSNYGTTTVTIPDEVQALL